MEKGNPGVKVIKLVRLGSSAVSIIKHSDADFRVEACKYFLGLKFMRKNHKFPNFEEASELYYDLKNDMMLKHRTL